MTVLVGCPVAHRAWVLPQWFDHVEKACALVGVKPEYAFVVDPSDESWPVIRERTAGAVIVPTANTKGDDTRNWASPHRFHEMVELRNALLAAVRTRQPEVFLSLDSDILLHPAHLQSMLEALHEYDAVGGKCFMTETGTDFPSWAQLGRDGGLIRTDAWGLFPVDVIMAIKLMSPRAYAIDYEHDILGEDIGWSKACARAGVTLGWDGRVSSKHVREPHMLEQVDPRVGY
jgi:hypothetical protein